MPFSLAQPQGNTFGELKSKIVTIAQPVECWTYSPNRIGSPLPPLPHLDNWQRPTTLSQISIFNPPPPPEKYSITEFSDIMWWAGLLTKKTTKNHYYVKTQFLLDRVDSRSGHIDMMVEMNPNEMSERANHRRWQGNNRLNALRLPSVIHNSGYLQLLPS